MDPKGLYATTGLLGEVAQIALLAVLLRRKAYRTFPIFTGYIAFNFFSDILSGALEIVDHSGALSIYAFRALLPVQYLLELGILLEIAWHVLRPVHPSLPRNSLKVFAGLLVLAFAGGVLLASHVDPKSGSLTPGHGLIGLDLTFGVLRMATFAAIAGFAQMLGIGWKNKVLQLATGLSFYSAVNLIVSLTQSHTGPSELMDFVRGAAYAGTLSFWIWAFSTKEAERKEFTPRMQEILVSLSGSAGQTRAALQRSQLK